MELSTGIIGLSVFVFIGVIVCLEIGLRLGRRNADKYPVRAKEVAHDCEH